MLSPIVTTITSAITTNAYQLAQSRSLRVYVRTPTRHIEARLVIALFREIHVTGTEGSRKMSLFRRSVLKVGGALPCYFPDAQTRSHLAQPEEGNVIHQIVSVQSSLCTPGADETEMTVRIPSAGRATGVLQRVDDNPCKAPRLVCVAV